MSKLVVHRARLRHANVASQLKSMLNSGKFSFVICCNLAANFCFQSNNWLIPFNLNLIPRVILNRLWRKRNPKCFASKPRRRTASHFGNAESGNPEAAERGTGFRISVFVLFLSSPDNIHSIPNAVYLWSDFHRVVSNSGWCIYWCCGCTKLSVCW